MAEQNAADKQDNNNPLDTADKGTEVAPDLDAWASDNRLDEINEVELSDDPFDLVEEEPDQAETLRRKDDSVLAEQIINLSDTDSGDDEPVASTGRKEPSLATLSTGADPSTVQADMATATHTHKPGKLPGKLKEWQLWIAAAILIPVITIGMAVLIKAFIDAKGVISEVTVLQAKISQLSDAVDKLPQKTELDLLRTEIDKLQASQKLFKNQLDDFRTLKEETTRLSESLKKQLLVISEDRRSMINDLTGMHTRLTRIEKKLQRLSPLKDRISRLEKQLAKRKLAVISKKSIQKKSGKSTKLLARAAPILRYRLLRVLQSDQDKVYAVAVSPDGQLLASAGTDDKLRLWNMQTGRLINVLEGHSNWITDVRFSPTGKWLASSSWDGTIKIWDSNTGAQVRTLLGHKRQVRTLAYAPNGKLLASGGTNNNIILWDPISGEAKGAFDGHINWIKDLEFSPDGKQLASASLDDTVRLWNIKQGTLIRVLSDHQAAVNAVAFSPDGHYLATASADTTIRVYPLPKGRSRVFRGHTEAINSLLFTPDSRHLLSGSGDGSIRVWNVQTGKTIQNIAAHDAAVTALALSPNGARLVSAGADGKVKIWEPYLDNQ